MASKKEYMNVFSRIGYGAKGFVYVILGYILIQTVIGLGGETKGAKDALQQIGSQPFGNIILILFAAGMSCYVVWRTLHAILDPDNKGKDFWGLIERAGFLLSAAMHAGLVFIAIKLILFHSSGGDDSKMSEQATATVMSFPLGRIIVGLVGLGVVGSGLYEIYFAIKEKYYEFINKKNMSRKEKLTVDFLAKAGLSLRGIVFAVIGVLFITAAINFDSDKAGGLADALDKISQQPFGQWLLAFSALGFIAYGLYMFALIKYREIT